MFAPDGLVARQQGGGWTQYCFDPEGSVAQRLDAGQNVLSSSAYDAYGTESSTAPASDPFGYHARDGYYADRETGLLYCQNRYYDPGTGRWVTRDPIGANGGINVYAYCGQGPVGSADPSGMGPEEIVEGPALTASVSKVYTFYAILTEDNEFLKWGMTDKNNPARRYTEEFYRKNNARMEIMFRSKNKGDVLYQERLMVKTCPGPLNKERWRGPAGTWDSPALNDNHVDYSEPDPRDEYEAGVKQIDGYVKEKQAQRSRAAHWWLEDED